MRNAKDITHTGYVRGAVYGNEEKHVIFFTGMTDEELFDLKCDYGKRWCMLFFQKHGFTEEEAAHMWDNEALIKQLWNNEWRRMDHYLIVPMLHKIQGGECANVYRELHLNVFIEDDAYRLWLEIGMMRVLKSLVVSHES